MGPNELVDRSETNRAVTAAGQADIAPVALEPDLVQPRLPVGEELTRPAVPRKRSRAIPQPHEPTVVLVLMEPRHPLRRGRVQGDWEDAIIFDLHRRRVVPM